MEDREKAVEKDKKNRDKVIAGNTWAMFVIYLNLFSDKKGKRIIFFLKEKVQDKKTRTEVTTHNKTWTEQITVPSRTAALELALSVPYS